MTPGNDEMNYKNLFREKEERTDIPEFDAILNLPAKQKKQVSGLSRLAYAMILCVAVATGTFYYITDKQPGTQTAKNEIQLMQDQKGKIWNWKSPTEQLLTTSLKTTNTNFDLPTDYFLPQTTSLQIQNSKKSNSNEK
jgi:hypothetical protein